MEKLMNIGLNFLNSATAFLGDETGVFDTYTKKLLDLVTSLLTPIFAVLATLGIVWSIVLGVQYIKAETTDKKEEAKKKMVNVIVGTAIMLVLVIIFSLVANNVSGIVTWVNGQSGNA